MFGCVCGDGGLLSGSFCSLISARIMLFCNFEDLPMCWRLDGYGRGFTFVVGIYFEVATEFSIFC